MPFKIKPISLASNIEEQRMRFQILSLDSFEIFLTGNDGKIEHFLGVFGVELINLHFNLLVEKEQSINKSTIAGLTSSHYEFEIHSTKTLVKNIQSKLLVENPEYTNIMKISLDDIIPERAVLILDTLIKVYEKYLAIKA